MHREVRPDRAVALRLLNHPSPTHHHHTAHTHTHITQPPPKTTLPCALTTRKTHATQQKAAPYTINTDGLARIAVNQHHTLNFKQKNISSTYHALQHQFMLFNRFLAHARRFNCICDRSTRCLATDPPTRSVASAESSSQAPRSSVELCHLPDRVALTAALPRAPPTPSQQCPQMRLNCSQPRPSTFPTPYLPTHQLTRLVVPKLTCLPASSCLRPQLREPLRPLAVRRRVSPLQRRVPTDAPN